MHISLTNPDHHPQAPIQLPRRILHGGDYSPEQWNPDVWRRDMELLREAGCNTLTVGIFAWAALEPEEGRYDFSVLDSILDLLHGNGFHAILATPTAAPPLWMGKAYPEIRMVDVDSIRFSPGDRVHTCPTSPVYREKTAAIDRELARRYARHPAVVMWHIGNEFCFHCYCDLCRAAFRTWLRNRYGSLDNLNRAWWTAFWGQTFSSWDQVEPPGHKRMISMEGLFTDWHRFMTDQTADFIRMEIATVKAFNPDLPATTNLMSFHRQFDYRVFARELDVVSYDAYPAYHDRPNNVETAVEQAFVYDMMRSLKHRPWILMETSPSSANWMQIMKLKRPGVHRLTGLQAVAHGSDAVLYFQWRASRGGREKLHGAVVNHDSDPNSRVFREVAELGADLDALREVAGALQHAEVGLIYEWDSRWMMEETCGPRRDGLLSYNNTLIAHYRPFWERGMPVDIIGVDDDVSAYKVVVAPLLHLLREGVAEKLAAFVESGGVLVTTYWSGRVDASGLCFDTGYPGPLRALLGIRSEELDVLYKDEQRSVVCTAGSRFGDGTQFTARLFCDLIHAEGANVEAEYGDDFYAGRPALTRHCYGEGEAWYIGFDGGSDFLDRFYGDLADACGLRRVLEASLPVGVTACERKAPGRDIIFLMNTTREPASVTISEAGLVDLQTGEAVSGTVALSPYDVKILARPAGT